MLESDFVVGWQNIYKEPFVGSSHGYTVNQTSVGTTNGAGPHNVQMFVISPDRVVMHALPGFWHPEDLARELKLAKEIFKLWQEDRSPEGKRDMFRRMQLAAVRRHPPETFARSRWQGFDSVRELNKLRSGNIPDTVFSDSVTIPEDKRQRPTSVMKPINVLVHERMAERPFVPFDEFDVKEFVDYGNLYYDLNIRVDGKGKDIPKPPKRRRS